MSIAEIRLTTGMSFLQQLNNIRDRIHDQAAELCSDVNLLNHRLHEAEEALKALCRRQLDLEEEIRIKANTLHIEEVQVDGMRASLLIQQF